MSSFFDKAKDKANQLASQAKDKVDEQQHKRKADDLLDDIGRIIYRQRTSGTVDASDDAAIEALVDELKALAELGTDILGTAPAAASGAAAPAAPTAPSSTLPPPAPAPTTTPEPQAFPTPE